MAMNPSSGIPPQDSAHEDVSHDTIYVVGFSGSVSEGAAAIKSPVFEINGRYFSGDPDVPPPRSHTYDRDQIEEYRERGLLSLVSKKQRRVPNHVFIYAQALFIRPSAEAFDLSSMMSLSPLKMDEQLGAYCAYMDRVLALKLLGSWAEDLILHAKKMLDESRFATAKEAAMRSRFGATLEHPELLQEAHCYVATARLGLGEDIRGVIQHVAIDFSGEEAHRVELKARELFDRIQRWKSQDLTHHLPQKRFSARFSGGAATALAA